MPLNRPAHLPKLQRPEQNLSRSSDRRQSHAKEQRSASQLFEKPQYVKHDLSKGVIATEQTILSLINGGLAAVAALVAPSWAIVLIPSGLLQLGALAEAAVCVGRRSRIKKGKGRYNLLKPGSYGEVNKSHITYGRAMRSLLRRTAKGNPTLKPNKGNPFEIYYNANVHYEMGDSPIRNGYKTIIYTRDRDLANRRYEVALLRCQHYLRKNPKLLKNRKYRMLLDEHPTMPK